jgi:two-component sensor histidine kinase
MINDATTSAVTGARQVRSSLTVRLIALMLMCIIPPAAMLFYNLYSLRQSQQNNVHEEAYRLGEVAALEISRIVGGVEDTLIGIAAAPVVRDVKTGECSAYMVRVSNALPQFSGIAVLDRQGIIRCHQKPAGIGVSLADKEYFKRCLDTGRTVLGRYTKGRVSKELVLPVAVPIRNDAGAVSGVVAGSINLKWLQQRLTERNFARSGSLTVADADGTIIARYPQPERFVGTRIPDQFQNLVHAVAPGTLTLSSDDGTEHILAYFPPSDPATSLYVSVGLSTAEEYSAITRAFLRGGIVTVGAVAVAFFLAWSTARYSIRRPMGRLVSTVEAWKKDDVRARTGLSKADGEFGIVGKAIDNYMDELIEVRGRSDILMRELDHRVKNLLATVQVITRQSLKAANVDPDILNALNARLVAMSEAHSVLMRNERHTASFVEVVRSAVRPFENPESTAFEISGPEITVGSTAALAFTMALHELATNAVKYGALSSDGKVSIHWSVVDTDSGRSMDFHWREAGGPAVATPAKSGFGTLMIRRMLADQLRGEIALDYAVHGLNVRLTVPLDRLG